MLLILTVLVHPRYICFVLKIATLLAHQLKFNLLFKQYLLNIFNNDYLCNFLIMAPIFHMLYCVALMSICVV
jgi:hypothetical protein